MSATKVSRTSYPDRDTWLEARYGIGASDLASAIGMSGFKTPLQLWKEKCGLVQPKDLSGNERVDFGNRAEEPLREMFRLMHPEFELRFTPYCGAREPTISCFARRTESWLSAQPGERVSTKARPQHASAVPIGRNGIVKFRSITTRKSASKCTAATSSLLSCGRCCWTRRATVPSEPTILIAPIVSRTSNGCSPRPRSFGKTYRPAPCRVSA